MAGFYIASFLIVIVSICAVVSLFIPLIFGVFIIPKNSNKKVLKVLIYGISIFFIQVLILCLTTFLAKPYSNLLSGTFLDGSDLSLLIFNFIPLLILVLTTVLALKVISKIILEKKMMTLIWIQSFILSFGITFATIITAAWLT